MFGQSTSSKYKSPWVHNIIHEWFSFWDAYFIIYNLYLIVSLVSAISGLRSLNFWVYPIPISATASSLNTYV